MQQGAFFIILVLLTGLQQGCARTVTADIYAVPALEHQNFNPDASFYVAPNPNTPNPIFDQTVKQKIEALLRYRGYRVTGPGQADYTIDYNYDVSGHTESRLRTAPGFGFGPSHFFFSGGRYHSGFSTHMHYTALVSENYPVYISKIRMRVLAPAQAGTDSGAVLWVGETWTESSEPDLRNMIDYLIAAGMRFFGQDTKEPKNIGLRDSDPFMAEIRKAEARQTAPLPPEAAYPAATDSRKTPVTPASPPPAA